MAEAAILDLFEPEIAQLDPPSRKPHPGTKHGVDRPWPFEIFEMRCQWVGRRSVAYIYWLGT